MKVSGNGFTLGQGTARSILVTDSDSRGALSFDHQRSKDKGFWS